MSPAERPLDDFPGVPKDKPCQGPRFSDPHRSSLDNPLQWWRYTPGASWKHPEGRQHLRGRADHPVA
jgi:hypothetical protein